MGGLHKYDLTSDVTHLIAGEYNTPKYRFVAKERPDVKVVQPSFVIELSELWMADKAFDLDTLERQHCRPTFVDLQICLTGFESTEDRQRIVDMVVANGGTYSGDLTKQVTHLIASKPEGAKYKYAKIWGLQIIAIEWLEQSLERGMILDESLYTLDMTASERGDGAWKRSAPTSPLGKRSRDAVVDAGEGKRRIRRTMSSKFENQNEQIWGDITGGSGSNTPVIGAGQWDHAPENHGRLQVARSMVVQPGGSTQLMAEVQPILDLAKGGAMDGCRLFIYGFSPRHEAVLVRHVISHDAEVVSSLDELYQLPSAKPLIVVPYTLPSSEFPPIAQTQKARFVTELWVEKCMEAKAFIDPETYPLGRPLPKGPLPGMGELTICSTGFSGVQILHLSKAVACLGAKYDENFSPSHTLLICNRDRPIRAEKLQFAKSCDIPVVPIEWLFETIKQGSLQAFKPFTSQTTGKRKSQNELRHRESSGHGGAGFETTTTKVKLKAPQTREFDTSAFETEPGVRIKKERTSSMANSSTTLSSFDDKTSRDRGKVEPLQEISSNSPKKPTSEDETVIHIEDDQAPPHKDMSFAISSLLASAKTTVTQPESTGPPNKRKIRILGRAASNVSRGSRASSVDSTASGGNAVIWPTGSGLHKNQSGEVNGSHLVFVPEEDESASTIVNAAPPSMTQIGYNDTESTSHRDQVMAKISGQQVVDRSHLDKVATLASLDQGRAGGRQVRKLRNR